MDWQACFSGAIGAWAVCFLSAWFSGSNRVNREEAPVTGLSSAPVVGDEINGRGTASAPVADSVDVAAKPERIEASAFDF